VNGTDPEAPTRGIRLSGRRRFPLVLTVRILSTLLVLAYVGYDVWHRSHPAPRPVIPPFAVGQCVAMDSGGDIVLEFDDHHTKAVGCSDPAANYVVVQQIAGFDFSRLASFQSPCPAGQTTLGRAIGGNKWTYCLDPKR
jgi:hypothetical protein